MIRTDFPFPVTEIDDWPIVMPDGTRLSARVWMPEGEGPFPAILEFLPYRKRDGTTMRDALTHPYFAGHGYVCVRVDMRGNGDSEGLMEDEYSEQELADAEEVIAQLAAQSWSNGAIGMMGISWGGFNGLQVAARQPEALKAVITLCSTVDRYADDIHYKGGCLLNENLGWGATMWSYSSRPSDPALREDWRELWLERLEHEPFLPALWLEHQTRDAYWQHGSVCEDFSAIKAPTLAIGGWGDAYKNAVHQLVEHLDAPVKGILGPWVHKYPHFAAPEPRIGFLQEALRWWDRWLKGAETGVENDPPLRVFVMEGEAPKPWYERREGRWIGIEAYPAPTRALAFEGLPKRLASPQTTGAQSGEYCAIWLGPEMPGDQRSDDAMSLTQDAPPEADALDIVGCPMFTARFRADKPLGKIAVRLCDVGPDGASARITYGVRNLAQGAWKDGEVEVAFPLDAIAYQLPAGHQLRLAVSSSYWPLLWPAPEDAGLEMIRAQITIPLLAQSEAVEFPPAETAPPLENEELRAADHVRETKIDHVSGVQTLRIVDDFGKVRNADHGLIHGSVARETWSIHPDQPISAMGHCHWTQEVERDDLRLRTEAFCVMQSDVEEFHLTARMEAYENDRLIFERTDDYTVPRHTQ